MADFQVPSPFTPKDGNQTESTFRSEARLQQLQQAEAQLAGPSHKKERSARGAEEIGPKRAPLSMWLGFEWVAWWVLLTFGLVLLGWLLKLALCLLAQFVWLGSL